MKKVFISYKNIEKKRIDIRFAKQELLTLLSSTKPLSQIKTHLNKKYYKPHEPKITLRILEEFIKDFKIIRPTTIKNIYNSQDTPRLAHKQRLTLYNQGLNDREISEKLNVHKNTIFNWRKEYKLKSRRTIKHSTISNIYSSNKGDCETAKQCGYKSRVTIAQWRRKHGIEPSNIESIKELKAKYLKFFELYNKGMNDTDIANKLKINRKTIYIWRQQNNFASQREMLNSKILKLYQQGFKDKKIATELGLTRGLINQWRFRNNLSSN